ncbi:MAG: GrpB family protein [Burkholderiales bacterium]
MTIAPAPNDRIEIVTSDPRWPAAFEIEAARIRAALRAHGEPAIEHIGSTAVPGLDAKPVIDILLIEADMARWPRFIAPLQALGYVFWADNPRRDRLFFVKGMPPAGSGRTHHVHVRTPADAQRECAFRDWLRAHAGDAARYAALKRELAAAHRDDREAYTEGKTAFIEAMLARG